ncbi:hypothetical protein G6F46_015626 [Rhizopus delemar]|nr:hypothetical protein G6F46_015626 [Rhizopus delemar]
MSMRPPTRFSCPPSARASSPSMRMLPAVARSSRPHCWALNCAPSSQTVLRRLSSSALCRLQRAVAAAAVPMRTCESNTALRPVPS